MAAPTVYKWTDAGAPQINRNDEADYQALFQAVLIDGYGTQSPPGAGTNKWSIPYSNATSFVLKQGGSATKKACIKLHSFGTSNNSYANVEAADDYTNLTTPVNKWAGFHSQDTVGLGYANNNSYNIPWVIIATERVLICQFGYNNDQANVSLFDTLQNETYIQNHCWYFGDYKSENAGYENNQILIHPQYKSTQTQYYCSAFTNTTELTYGKKNFAATFTDAYAGEVLGYGLYTRAITDASVHPGSKRTQDYVPQYPNPLNGGLYLERYRLLANYAIMGELYGVVLPIQNKPFPNGAGQFTFSGTGDFAGEDIMAFTDYYGQYCVRLGDWGVE